MSVLSVLVRRHVWLRMLWARPRLVLSVCFGGLVVLGLPHLMVLQPVTRYIVGWNAGAGLYLLLALRMIFRASEEHIRRRAHIEDEGQWLVLGLVIVAAIISLMAIVAELAVSKDMHGYWRSAHIALAILTILSSWLFTHVMFALHYAHDYYTARARGIPPGLEFPGAEALDYSDFLYFSCIIGTSGQTADVSFSSRRMRRLGTLHCVVAFFYNATVLALMINIAAGLI
ncbi:DUF1345 domain-containing protein [Paludibacterium denitrificans]|uniref:DUF1345 domain-containing protein n=1 Tax=Paludibacterium denitrificans TaxID=2675226 RepID=A0A844GDV7_9NEIS|nr:DUF1345 domain-containing protein [Paludibacterium denitrificans]MTD33500.1 DUF1345 domain-containing protein [Paludibacterium denitrificans]HJV06339.1 DUF1345 domain-containing protein [Chromobacteriaceae bacterium]